MDLHHPILREFPEHRDTIKRLQGDQHFRHLYDEYHRLDDAIYRIEEEIDELKMRRAKLKDYIYHLIKHAPDLCPSCQGTGTAR